MGISDDIRPKKRKAESEKTAVDNSLEKEDISDIIEPLPDETPEARTQHNDKSFFEDTSNPKKQKKAKSIWLVILLILLVAALIGVAIYQNFDLIERKLLGKETATKTSETATIEAISNTSESETLSQDNQDIQPSQSNEAPETVVTPPVIDKTSFSIRVSNGNGVKGAADAVRDTLKNAGFNVVSVGNASSYSYKTTIIYYKISKEAEANLVKEALSNRSVSLEASETLKAYDVLVIVGSK